MDWSGCLKAGDGVASKQRLHTGLLNFHACLYQKLQETITLESSERQKSMEHRWMKTTSGWRRWRLPPVQFW